MHAKNATELIALTSDPGVSDEEFGDAFLHYVPSDDDGYERLLYAMALYRPKAILDMGLDIAHVQRIADLLREVRRRRTSAS